MKTIIIIFFGLIVHVNQPDSFDDTAVLPAAPFHVQKMLIPVGSVLNPQDAWVQRQPQVGSNYEISLENLDVRLQGTTGTFCNKDAIVTAVPKLPTISPRCGGLKRAVRERDNTSKLVAYVDYGAGKLSVESYFPKKLGFGKDPDKDPQSCVACRVRYEGTLAGDEALLVFTEENGTTHEIRVSKGAQLEVQNLPEYMLGKHFHFHYEILNDCDDGTDTFIGKDCTESAICDVAAQKNAEKAHPLESLVQKAAGVLKLHQLLPFMHAHDEPFPLADCTNSQYP